MIHLPAVFLDIDGVFNSTNGVEIFDPIDPYIVEELLEILLQHRAAVVWSTSHRILHKTEDTLFGYGVEAMLRRNYIPKLEMVTHKNWYTPSHCVNTRQRRYDEIISWIMANELSGEEPKYGLGCIVDDIDVFDNCSCKVITNGMTGLTTTNVLEISAKLTEFEMWQQSYEHQKR